MSWEIEPFEDLRDPRVSRRGRRVCCATFNLAGVLESADVHVAQRLGSAGSGERRGRALWRSR